MNKDEKFCFNCGWNDSDYGCTCPPNEKVYQCQLYIHNHPNEVNQFNESIQKWAQQIKQRFEKIN